MTRRPAVLTAPELLTPGEVAKVLRVDPRTVTHWARMGRVRFTRTPGGHRRYYAADVHQMAARSGPRQRTALAADLRDAAAAGARTPSQVAAYLLRHGWRRP